MSGDDPTPWWKMDLMIRHSTLKWRGEASSSPSLASLLEERERGGRRNFSRERGKAGGCKGGGAWLGRE
ncbi:hypothetical protein KFK09_015879 [Dendrobium nobile]|uniref:Uncharacterized protein n=1 Tax=Dendrobium nobile TaxID=94219 RepID=A0A8T3B799_DENNO|nr:hypothetical protein KFK09_015879 [Dendrobium nobile]